MSDDIARGWDGFLEWAGRFRSISTFDAEERDYKRRAVGPLAEARTALRAGGDWLPALRRGFTIKENNLVSHWAFTPFLAWAEASPAEAAAALRALWATEGTVPERVDLFTGALPPDVVSGVGSRANLASYLLASTDLEGLPVYRVTAFKLAYELTGFPATPKNAGPGEMYAHGLAFLDELLERGRVVGIDLRDRLDAQSVTWCVTQWQDRPDEFSDQDWAGLMAFRTITRLRRPSNKTRAASAVRRPRRPICPLCGNDDEVRLVGRLDEGWEFVCEVGPGHFDPFTFSAR